MQTSGKLLGAPSKRKIQGHAADLSLGSSGGCTVCHRANPLTQ